MNASSDQLLIQSSQAFLKSPAIWCSWTDIVTSSVPVYDTPNTWPDKLMTGPPE